MQVYENLVDAINGLKLRGYTTDFNLAFDALECKNSGTCLSPDEFEIVEHYRFEANTDPSDSSVLYVIKAIHSEMKGILVDAYGAYGEALSDNMIRKLKVHK